MSELAMTIDDEFVEQVEDELGMGHGAWDMVKAEDICRAVLKVAESKLATERKQAHDTDFYDQRSIG